MKSKFKVKNYHRFIFFIIFLILIVLGSATLFFYYLNNNNNKNDNNNANANSDSIEISPINDADSSINENELQYVKNNENETNGKNKKNQRKSKAIPLAAGEKSTNSLPVLMYHFFYNDIEGETAPNSNYMPVSSFEEQLKYLSENDYYYPTWEEVADFVDGKIDLPDKSVVLTMDDGDESVFELALPLLEKYNVIATAFIITSDIDENELAKYSNSILDLQSHTDNMHRTGGNYGHGGIFPALPIEESTADLKTSIKKLSGNSGALAYPFGDCNENTKKAAENAGFKVAFTTVNDKVKPGMDKYELPRLRMFTDIKLAGFKYYVQ